MKIKQLFGRLRLKLLGHGWCVLYDDPKNRFIWNLGVFWWECWVSRCRAITGRAPGNGFSVFSADVKKLRVITVRHAMRLINEAQQRQKRPELQFQMASNGDYSLARKGHAPPNLAILDQILRLPK